MKKPKESAKHQSKKRPAEGKGAGGGRARGMPLLLVGAVVSAAVAVVLILMLLPKAPKAPEDAQPQGGAEVPADGQPATDLVLRNETFEVARRLMADFPESAFPIGLMGTLHNQFGNSTEAEKWWLRCLERDPRRADVYEVLAVAYLRKGEYQRVAELLQRAQAINPNMPGVHRRYAEALMEMGELDEALVALEKEMKIAPNVSENYLVFGKIYVQRKEYEKAVAAYTKALELRPGDTRCYYGLANASRRLGQSDKATEYMETFSKLRAEDDKVSTTRRMSTDQMRKAAPILAETLVDVGRVYNEHRQVQKAEACWQRAAALDTTNTASRVQLVDLYRRARRRQEAVEVAEQLRRIDPKNASYHQVAGVALAELKRFDAAEVAIRQAIELAPGHPAGYRSLVEVLLLSNQKLPEAKALAQRAVELSPTAWHYFLLGKACSRNQDHSGALAAVKRAAELAPDNEEIRKAYEKLQETK
jgi:tetratricopeptide (TPR) repeat protein